jgi:hypothetical protein
VSQLVYCSVCACAVTPEQAEERGWVQLFGAPVCQRACAEVLYEPAVVRERYREPARVAQAPPEAP